VTGNVEFRNDADAAIPGVIHHLPDLRLRVVEAVRSFLMEFRKQLAFDAKALIVRQMPVEDIQLDRRHRVEIAQDDLDRHPMTGDIHHQPAPGKSRAVVNLDSRDSESLWTGSDQLNKSLHPPQRPSHRAGDKVSSFRADAQSVGLILSELWVEWPGFA